MNLRPVLEWIVARGVRLAAIATVLGALPAINLLAGGLIALATLKRGPAHGLQVAGIGVLLGLGSGLITGTGAILAIQLAQFWLPVWLSAVVLGRTGSLSLAAQTTVGLVIVGLFGFYLIPENPDGLVREYVETWVLPFAREVTGGDVELSTAAMDAVVGLVPGIIGMASAVGLVLAVFFGSWWQAVLGNTNGFREAFHRFSNGRSATVIGVAVFTAAALTDSGWIASLTLVLSALFFFQGVAVVHRVAAPRPSGKGWLAALYAIMVLAPMQVFGVLSGAGLLDNWFDFRRYAVSGGAGGQ